MTMLNRVKGHTAAAIIFSAMAALMAVDRSVAAPTTQANVMVELKFKSAKAYDDPFNQVRLDVVFTDPRSKEFRVPAFWAGGKVWRVRYASPVTGVHHYETHCSDDTDTGLNGQKGTVEVLPYHGSNPLYRHGPLHQSADRRHFEQADGTPFLWLGDTWWMSLCKRLHYPDEFESLLKDRNEKGFNVIQIVAGLYPDMPAFDPRGANEAGFPWTKDYKTIRPEYFDAADRRILKLVDSGLVPCIVGAWGCYLPWTGVERMKQHWRYLVSRYGALPVVWCVAGEVNQPFTLSKTRSKDKAFQSEGWTEVARDLHRTDPFHRLVTAHPPNTARNVFTDPSVLDFDMLQTGHSDRQSLPSTIRSIRASRAARPTLPVVIGEVCYEGILECVSRRRSAAHGLGQLSLRGSRPHLRGQRNLAIEPQGAAVRPVPRRPQLGNVSLGRRYAAAGVAPSRFSEEIPGEIPLVAVRATPRMGRLERSVPPSFGIRRPLRGGNRRQDPRDLRPGRQGNRASGSRSRFVLQGAPIRSPHGRTEGPASDLSRPSRHE